MGSTQLLRGFQEIVFHKYFLGDVKNRYGDRWNYDNKNTKRLYDFVSKRKFDEYGNALLPTTKGANFKPLVNSLKTLNKKLYWLLPIAKNKKNLYDVDQDEAEEYNDINSLTLAQSQVKTATGISNY